jgi:flagellar hook protein FlgE
MFTSFSAALSALSANATAIDVVGNNLANLNSTGFKTSEVIFRDLVTQSLGAGLGETQVGFGTGQPLTVRHFTQGAIQTTSGLLDGAIQGDGFFVLEDTAGQTYYTRAGNFQTDSEGNLMTDTGQYVMGWTTLDATTGEVDTNGSIGKIVVPVGSLKEATATSELSIDLNLNASSAVGTSSNYSTEVTTYDSLGTSHVLTFSFQKTASNTWSYDVTVPATDTGGTSGTTSIGSGTFSFDSSGALTDPAAGTTVSLSITGLSDGAADMDVTWSPFDSAGSTRITQFSSDSTQSATSQNGSEAAELIHVGLSTGGYILAEYSNGDQVKVGMTALASIRNSDTLIAAGDNNFKLSARTATPSVGVPGTGGRGTIVGGATEASTVDIATQFTRLIVYQRAYEASSKVVNAANELSQTTINLIR